MTGCGHETLGDLCRLGAAAGREEEREGAVVADLLDERERLREVLLGLSWEADDDVGRERHVGDVLADQRDAVEVALAVVGAAHRPEDARGAGLQRQVDVLAESTQLGVGADHILAHVLGVRAGVADALDALDRVERAQQLGEAAAGRTQVAPVGVDVLPEQRDLAHPLRCHRAHLSDELLEGP